MPERVTMDCEGVVVVSATVRDQIGLPHGGDLVLHVEDGAVKLEPISRALTRVRSLVSDYVPEGVSLAEELIIDRRIEADREL